MRVLALIFIVILVLLTLFKPVSVAQPEALPVMNASILFIPYYYIMISDKLWEGIFYTNATGARENIQYPLLSGSSNNSAVWNYNKTSGKTEYWIYFGGNVNGSICHGATNHLCSRPGCSGFGNYMIDISNAKWSSSFVNDLNNPGLSRAIPFTIGIDNANKVYTNVAPETKIYMRYWLDIPPGSPAANYNTTYVLRVVMGGESCV